MSQGRSSSWMRALLIGAAAGGAAGALFLTERERRRRAEERVPEERLREAMPPRNPRALAHTRVRHAALLLDEALTFGFLVAAARKDRPLRLRRWLDRLHAPRPVGDGLFGVTLLSAYTAAMLPVSFTGGYLADRAFGLSRQSPASWAADAAKGFGVSVALTGPATAGLYAVIRRAPKRWFLWAGGLWALLALALSNLAPLLIDPLYHRYTPLADEELRRRLENLARAAGLPVLGVFEADWSRKTKKANAYLTGVGNTRRIVLTDTLLQGYTHDEIASILAHELGHHRYGHIRKSLLYGTAAALASFALADDRLAGSGSRPGYEGKGDVATLPSLALFLNVLGLFAMPVASAVSRAWERESDCFSLEMTRDPKAFISAMRKLAEQNLTDPAPPAWIETLLYDHPSIRERIRMGLEWEDAHAPDAEQRAGLPSPTA